jgi:outer membrane autotransporter protein
LAAHLQQVWNSGSDLNGGFAALKSLSGPQALGAALSSITGAAVQGVAAAKQAASERFFDNLVNCEAAPASGSDLFREDSCGWVRVLGNHTGLSSTDDDPGYHQNSVTYQAGGQREISPGWFVGGSLGLESSSLSGDSANVTGRTGLAGLMIKHQMGPWMLTGEIDGSYGTYDSSRLIVAGTESGTATASPSVSQAGTYLRGAYQTSLTASTYVEPSLTVGAHYTQMGQYNESGSTNFNLTVHDSGNMVYSANPMIEFGTVGSLGKHPMRAFVDVGAAVYSNSNWRSDASLEAAPAGTGTFDIDSKLPSVVGKVKAGLDVYARDGLDVRVSYGADLASGFISQSALAKLTYSF